MLLIQLQKKAEVQIPAGGKIEVVIVVLQWLQEV